MPEITYFAKTNFRNQERVFGIKTDDRRRHMYVIGKTGMGKTNLLENLVIQDIQDGHGVAFIDPHGETAEKLVKAIPASRINDVIYFNPADQDFPIAFNVMEKVDPEYRHLVASGLVGVFKKIWADSWGPRLEYILRNAILALLEYPGSTLLGIMRILVDKKYRARVVEKVSDPVVKSFWLDEFTQWNERVLQEVVSPIQNKVGQFLSSSLVRNIVGQTKSSFDIREAMDNRKILILNLSKGRIGEDNSALLGAMMVTKIQLAAMGRVDMPEEERKDFYLYVDEFQNFATESFANILSEARKYHLCLVLTNQYITQLPEEVRDAIFGNAGTIVSFRVGAMDAEFLEKEFFPVFLANDLVNLPKYHVYLKLLIDGIAGDAFSATTLPPVSIEETKENEEKVIRVSRERYASSRKEVEDKIARWSGIIDPEKIVANKKELPSNAFVPLSENKNTVKMPEKNSTIESFEEIGVKPSESSNCHKTDEKGRTLFDAVCDTCSTGIQIPFKPDTSRPTFCKDCFKDYQRAVAKSQNRQKQAEDQPRDDKAEKKTFSRNASDNERERRVEPKRFYTAENPMSLHQMQYIAPKKFRPSTRKSNVDFRGLRELIEKSKKEKTT